MVRPGGPGDGCHGPAQLRAAADGIPPVTLQRGRAGSGRHRLWFGGRGLANTPGLMTPQRQVGGSHTPLPGAEYAESGLMIGTCTGIWTWVALVDGKGFVAEMGAFRAFQTHFCKHLDSRAGSGRGVHRPYWKGAVGASAETGRGCRAPIGKLQYAPSGMRRGLEYVARAGPGCGIGPGEPVVGDVVCGKGGHGVGRSGRRRRRQWRRDCGGGCG